MVLKRSSTDSKFNCLSDSKNLRNNVDDSCSNLAKFRRLLLPEIKHLNKDLYLMRLFLSYYSWTVQINLTLPGRLSGIIRGVSKIGCPPLSFVPCWGAWRPLKPPAFPGSFAPGPPVLNFSEYERRTCDLEVYTIFGFEKPGSVHYFRI